MRCVALAFVVAAWWAQTNNYRLTFPIAKATDASSSFGAVFDPGAKNHGSGHATGFLGIVERRKAIMAE